MRENFDSGHRIGEKVSRCGQIGQRARIEGQPRSSDYVEQVGDGTATGQTEAVGQRHYVTCKADDTTTVKFFDSRKIKDSAKARVPKKFVCKHNVRPYVYTCPVTYYWRYCGLTIDVRSHEVGKDKT